MTNQENTAAPIVILCDIVGSVSRNLLKELAENKLRYGDHMKAYLSSSVSPESFNNSGLKKKLYEDNYFPNSMPNRKLFEDQAFLRGELVDLNLADNTGPAPLALGRDFKLNKESYLNIAGFLNVPVENILLIDDDEGAVMTAIKAGANGLDPENYSAMKDQISMINKRKAVFDQNKIDMALEALKPKPQQSVQKPAKSPWWIKFW